MNHWMCNDKALVLSLRDLHQKCDGRPPKPKGDHSLVSQKESNYFLGIDSYTLFGLSLLTILEGLCHFHICSSVLFNWDLGLSSSKSVTAFPLSSMFCSVSFSSSSVPSCSSSGISTSSGSNPALNWSAWANIGCLFFSSTAVFCPFHRICRILLWPLYLGWSRQLGGGAECWWAGSWYETE